MEFPMNKKLLSAAIVAALSVGLTACHDDDDPVVVTPPPVANGDTVISGNAVKGAVAGGFAVACAVGSDCAAYELQAGEDNITAATTAFEGQTGFIAAAGEVTADDGSYSISVPADAAGLAAIVRVLPISGTTQTCDFDGCDPNVVTELKTATFIEAATGTEPVSVSTPVSALSTVATEVLEEAVADDADIAGSDATAFASVLNTVSDNVETVLGVSVDSLFEVEVVSADEDTLAPTDGEAPSAAVQSISLLNAAVGGAGGTLVADIVEVASGDSTDAVAAAATIVTTVTTAVTNNTDDFTSETIEEPTLTAPTEVVIVTVPDVNPDGSTGASSGAGDL